MKNYRVFTIENVRHARNILGVLLHTHVEDVLWLLRKKGTQNVKKIADELQIESIDASKTLVKLHSYGYVTVVKDGRNRFYSINEDKLARNLDLGNLLTGPS